MRGESSIEGEKVLYENKIYVVLFDYKNGQIEIQALGPSLTREIKLVYKDEVQRIDT